MTTKIWNDRQIHGGVRDSVLESLDALGLDYLDLLLVHWPIPGFRRATWELLQDIQGEGFAISIGVSNFSHDDLVVLQNEGGAVPVVNQIEHHLYYQDVQTIGYCRTNGIVCEAWAPFGLPECADNPVVAEIADNHGVTARQVMLAWIMQRGIVPLPRTGSACHARSNAAAVQTRLYSNELERLDALNRNEPRREHVVIDKPSPHD